MTDIESGERTQQEDTSSGFPDISAYASQWPPGTLEEIRAEHRENARVAIDNAKKRAEDENLSEEERRIARDLFDMYTTTLERWEQEHEARQQGS